MSDERPVECQDCGYRWRSTAESPRCSKAECGRSRNVEPVDELDESADEPDDGQEDEPEPTADGGAPDDELDDEPEPADESGGFSPAFQSRTNESTVGGSTEPVDVELDDVDDDGSADDAEHQETAEDGSQTPQELPDIDPEQLSPAFSTTFSVIARERGEHWALDEDESDELAEAWAPVLNHYAPAMMKQHSTVAVAVLATVSVVGPKLAEDRRLRELDEREERAARDSESGTVREGRVYPKAEDELDDELDEPTVDAGAPDEALGGYASV